MTCDPSIQSGENPCNRYKLTIAYDGKNFHGWQKQWQTAPPGQVIDLENRKQLRTVAGVVEQTLHRILQQPIRLVGASRTDAGVHALGQVAHFDATPRIPIDRLAQAINSRLPENVEVRDARIVHPDFDAISDAVSKRYIYRIYNTSRRPLEKRHVVWHCWTTLDVQKMKDAAHRLVGTHDFGGFAAAGHGRSTTIRTVLACNVSWKHPEVHISVEGTGFLYNMVRIIAGTLVEVGRGRFDPAVVDQVIQSADRSKAGPTLPATGLCLQWIRYPDPPAQSSAQLVQSQPSESNR